MKYIYKVTFPNGKIYIGQDRIGDIKYLGSADPEIFLRDLTAEQIRDFRPRKEILWRKDDATLEEINREEIKYILQNNSNDPEIGYNRFPKFRKKP